MSLGWLLSDLHKLEPDYRRQEILRSIELARAREIERAGRPRRMVFPKRFRYRHRS